MQRESLADVLQDVALIDLPFDGMSKQENGLDLPVVVINLRHRTDRWQTVSRRMAGVGLTKLIKAPAIEGARLSEGLVATLMRTSTDITKQPPRSHLALTRPAIGCFLSHLAVWRWVLDAGISRALIFEDDAAPAAHFCPKHFRATVDSLPENAGLVFLGRIIMGGLADRPDGSNLPQIYYFNGTFAYLVKPTACETLLRHLLPMHSHIDHQISRVLIEQRRTFPAYYTEPHFFEPDWSLRSDCYVPLADDAAANAELGQLIEANRTILLGEGRLLLDAM